MRGGRGAENEGRGEERIERLKQQIYTTSSLT